MKHTRPISSQVPAKAAYWQELVCSLSVMVNAVMAFTGGSVPFVLYIEDKCDIPVPGSGETDSTA